LFGQTAQRAVFPHPHGAGRTSESGGDLHGIQLIEVRQPKELAIISRERLKCVVDR
jgi:hypothetical protein